jgi:transcriptional regulator with XRE-family HTH domain
MKRRATMNIDYKLIGERIKRERKGRGMTQEALAEKLDVSIGYVSQVERGITKISLDLLGAISGILGCDISSLVTGCAATNQQYLSAELVNELGSLNGRKRRLLLDFAKLLNEA